MDAFERLVYGRDERDSDDEAWEDADVADDGLADEASASSRDRQWTDEEKALVVRECCWSGTRPGEVARRYGLSANRVNAWRSQARRGKLPSPFSPETEAEPAAQAERTLAARKAEDRAGPCRIETVAGVRLDRGGGVAAGFGRFGVDRGAWRDGPP